MPEAYENKSGQKYYLHAKQVTLKGGRAQLIYFFAREIKDGVLDQVPPGYKILENERTGLLILERIES